MLDQALLIRKAKLKLFTKQLIFFGMCANKFNWEFEKFDESVEAFVRFQLSDLTKLENGIIHFNTHFTTQQDYTYDNLVFVICHELLHILNKHGARQNERKFNEWNVACDHVIEIFLKKLSSICKPFKNRYNIIDALERENPNCTAEQAYDWIIKHQSTIKIQNNQDMKIDVFDQNNILLYTVIVSPEDDDSDLSTKNLIIDQIVAESRAIFENIRGRGDLPGYMIEYLENILKVEIPWETLVEKSIKTNIIMKPDDRTWRNLNKFFIPHKINLPGYSLIQETEGVGHLIICVDSSGSISSRSLKKFSGIIESSMRYFKIITVLIHDVKVHQKKTFNNDTIGQFYEFVKNEGYRGRGGTSHKYVFDEIQTEYWEKDKDDLSMVICLTDGVSDIEEIYQNSKYTWIKNNLPLTFILTKGSNRLHLNPSFGTINQIVINN